MKLDEAARVARWVQTQCENAQTGEMTVTNEDNTSFCIFTGPDEAEKCFVVTIKEK